MQLLHKKGNKKSSRKKSVPRPPSPPPRRWPWQRGGGSRGSGGAGRREAAPAAAPPGRPPQLCAAGRAPFRRPSRRPRPSRGPRPFRRPFRLPRPPGRGAPTGPSRHPAGVPSSAGSGTARIRVPERTSGGEGPAAGPAGRPPRAGRAAGAADRAARDAGPVQAKRGIQAHHQANQANRPARRREAASGREAPRVPREGPGPGQAREDGGDAWHHVWRPVIVRPVIR